MPICSAAARFKTWLTCKRQAAWHQREVGGVRKSFFLTIANLGIRVTYAFSYCNRFTKLLELVLGNVFSFSPTDFPMTSKFNPYKKWLGLKTQYVKPHYFELFDLSPSLTGQAEITEVIDAAVKRSLKLLSEVPVGEDDALVGEIQERVLRAQKVLSNPETRLAYLKQLKLKTRERTISIPTKSEPSLVPPLKSKTSKPNDVLANDVHAPPSPNAVEEPAPVQTQKQKSVSPSPPMAAQPVAVSPQSGLPMAIPLAKPLTSHEPVESEDPSLPMSGEVKINPKIRRRRRSQSLAFLSVLSMVSMLAGGCYLIFVNWSVFENFGGVAGGKDSTSLDAGDQDSAGLNPIVSPTDGADDSDVDARPLPKIDLTKLEELDESVGMSKPNRSGLVDGKDDDDDMTMDSDDSVVEKEVDRNNPDPSKVPKPDVSVAVKFNEVQLAQYARYINRARISLFRRDKARAGRAIENAKRIRGEVGSEPGVRFVEEQAAVASLADELTEVYDLIDGFWSQVIASSTAISGGQELNAANQIVSFVEADQDKVILRNAGSNITYQYSFCPPALAVVLAQQGSIKDIPTWNTQLAAFYALNQTGGVNYKNQIDTLLREAEAAGHSCDSLRHFANFDFSAFAKPVKKVKFPNKKAQLDGILSFRTEQEYKAVSDLSPGRAIMAAQALEGRLSNDVGQDVIFLEEIRKLGVRSGDALIVDDAVGELDRLSSVNGANLICESYLEMANSELSVSQRRGLMEVAIPFLKSKFSRKAKLKPREDLVRALAKLAQAYGMVDSARRLNQVEL
jgi:hypothetical protein